MSKTDIYYELSCGKHRISCIDEFTENSTIHHSNGVLFLMDNPNSIELRTLNSFAIDKDILKSMQVGESRTFGDVTVEVKDVVEGGIWNE